MRRLALAPALLLAAGSARAAEVVLEPGWSTRVGWDSNVLRSADDQIQDGLYQVGPILNLRGADENLTWKTRYRLVYEDFFSTSGTDVFDHFFQGDATWRVGPRTQLVVREGFSRAHSVNGELLDDPVDFTPEIEVGRQLATGNDASLEFVHDLGPRWQLLGVVNHAFTDYDEETRFDTSTPGANLQVQYRVSARDVVGLGVGLIAQTFDEAVVENAAAERRLGVVSSPEAFLDEFDASGRDTSFGQVFGFWSHRWSPTLTTSLQGGPALASPDTEDTATVLANPVFQFQRSAALLNLDSCPVVDGVPVLRTTVRTAAGSQVRACSRFFSDGSVRLVDPDELESVALPVETADDNLTFFGRFVVTKAWRDLVGELELQRTASTTSGTATSTTVDSVDASLLWTPTPDWRITLGGRWNRREAANEVVVNALVVERDPVLSTTTQNVARAARFIELGTTSDAIDIQQWSVSFQVQRRLSERLSVLAGALWFLQQRGGALEDQPDTDYVRATVGFTWDFDEVRLF